MEITGLANMAMSLNKAEVGQNILSKTLQKTAAATPQQMQAPKSLTTVAAMTGKGTKIDTFA